MDKPRIEPSATMREFAAINWQMYNALVQEGFSEKEALVIIGHVIAASLGGNSGSR